MDSSKCLLCKSDTSKVMLMSCKDKLCSSCVCKQIFQNHLQHFQLYDEITINCPCGKGSITLNITLIQQHLKLLLDSDQVENHCQKHNCTANYYCEDCSKSICDACIKVHKESKVCHTIIKSNSKSSSSSTNRSNHRQEEELPVKMPYKSFAQFSKHIDETFDLFEQKYQAYEAEIEKNINKTIAALEKYKKTLKDDMRKTLDREGNVIKMYKMFYQLFYEEMSSFINKNDQKSLKELCSINRMFGSIEIGKIAPLIENIEQIKDEVDNYLDNMKPVPLKYCFPSTPRIYTDSSTLLGHTDIINCACLLKDGSIASGGRDPVIKIWTKTAKGYVNTHNLSGHKGWVSNLLLLNDNQLLSGSHDGNLKIWDTANNFNNIHTLSGHSKAICSSLQFSNGILISSSSDNTMIVRNGKAYQKVDTLREHTFGVFALCLLPENSFASAGGDKTIKIWNSELAVIKTIKGQNTGVSCLGWLNNHNYLAAGGHDGMVKIWNIEIEECVYSFKAHNEDVSCLLVLPDGRIVTGASDNLIKVWDDENNFAVTHILKGHSAVVTSLILTSEGNILSTSADAIMKIWSEEKKILND